MKAAAMISAREALTRPEEIEDVHAHHDG